MKKLLSLLLLTIIMVSMCTVSGVPAYDINNTLESQVHTQQINSGDSIYGDFQYAVLDGKVTITKYTGSAKILSIPSEIDGNPVTSIGRYAFSGCDSLTDVTIPNTVGNIYEFAFHCCRNLISIEIPSSVKMIHSNMFLGCNNLTNINVNTNNSEYSSVNGILFNKGQTEIIRYPEGKKDEHYIIPNSVINIFENAFYDCINLKKVTIPNTVKNIGKSAFYNCNQLTHISIPNGVINIEKGAFTSCDKLISIDIPISVSNIGACAFYGCVSLINVVIPNKVTNININTFYACSSLKNVILSNGVKIIDRGAFRCCKNLTNILISNSVTNIGSTAFLGCDSLKQIFIPDSVTQIDDYAFGYYEGSRWNKIPDFKIFGRKSSTAEIYAHENGFNFEEQNDGYSASNPITIDEERYIFDENEAKRFLCFIFNSDQKNIDIEDNEFYSYLIGDDSRFLNSIDTVEYSLLISAYQGVAGNLEKYEVLKEKTAETTIFWLNRMLGNKDPSVAVVNEYLNQAKGMIKKELCKIVAESIDSDFFDVDIFDSEYCAINKIINVKKEANDIINKVFTSISLWCHINNYSKSGMYDYFEQYLKLRSSFDSSSDNNFIMIMDTYYSEYRYLPSYWRYSKEELNRWGEFLYNLDKNIKNRSSQNEDIIDIFPTEPSEIVEPKTEATQYISPTEKMTNSIKPTEIGQIIPSEFITVPTEPATKSTDFIEQSSTIVPTESPSVATTNTICSPETETNIFSEQCTEKNSDIYLLGDINNDSQISLVDVIMIQRIILDIISPDERQLIVCDINNDKKINLTDVTILMNILLGK